MREPSWKRGALWFGGALLAVFGSIALAHTAFGRPLLNALGAPGCPVSLDGGDPREVEAFRQRELAQRRGTRQESSRPGWIFELGRTRKRDVLAWRERSGAKCEAQRRDSVLRCADIASPTLTAAATPTIIDLHLQFDPQDRLVAVDLFRSVSDGAAALSWLEAVDRDLAQRVGASTSQVGVPTPQYLEQNRLNRVAREYRYRNYVAEVSAMNFGARGVRVRERYQWLSPDGA